MTRRSQIDVAIVGGGVVGAACALALADLGLDVALVEARRPSAWSASKPDLRVYAFAPDNADLLDSFGVWNAVRDARLQPYRRMRVWDAAGGGELAFDADALGRRELGWIVEHGLLVDRLWAALAPAGVRLHCPARVESLEQDADSARITLDDGSRIDARLLVAADGAGSSLRRLAGIEVAARNYGQRGVVGFVSSQQPHAQTCWQRFLPSGPLAVLPFTDSPTADAGSQTPGPGFTSSIVWTLPDAEATRVLALDDVAFGRELTTAFDATLGDMWPLSSRVAFPLRRQLASAYVSGRVVLIGDAAHVVHPLAGQGVNLGLRDVVALRDSVASALSRRSDFAAPSRLARWARQRRSDNAIAAHAFDAVNRLYSNDAVAATLLRGPLMGITGRIPPLTRALWRHAAGV